MRIVVVGEGMIELSQPPGQNRWRLGYGGDTLNTAVHLARLGQNVAYATALGNDNFSDDLRAAWAAEGVDTSLILIDTSHMPGLYAIHTDARGERSFSYWRSDSAARYLFALPAGKELFTAATTADLLCYSLISLAILPHRDRKSLIGLAQAVRARGGRVAFDGNYRPRLWPSAAEATAVRDAALAHCDIGLPTLDDELALFGAPDADAVAAHWQALGVDEVVVKLGAKGARLPDGTIVAPPVTAIPVDTSGAGDAFNAGYLDARLRGATIEDAALAGHRLAAWVVTEPGAIPARSDNAPY